MRYRIGLDIGSTSVGWAVLEDDEFGDVIGIVDLGVRIFEAAQVPKTGASLAEERSKKRSIRRQNRRKAHRVFRTKKLLIDSNIITKDEVKNLYSNKSYDIYNLRVKALDFEISKYELSALLINFVKRRGYKTNAKNQNTKNDNGKVLNAVLENRYLLLEKGYRTVGQMYLEDDKFKYKLKNGEYITDSNGKKIIKIRNEIGDYNSTVERDFILDEINKILDVQKKYNKNITNDFIKEYIKIFLSQRNFDEGPAFPSKYSGNVVERTVGKCTFEKEEIRAPKSSYTFEMFKLLQDLNRIRIINIYDDKNNIKNSYKNSNGVMLDERQKNLLIEKFKLNSELSYPKIRSVLKLPYNYIFSAISYEFDNVSDESNIKEIIDKTEESFNFKFKELEAFNKIRKALDKYEKDYIFYLNDDTLDYIAVVLTVYKSDEKRIEYLSKIGFDKEIINLLLGLSFSTFCHLSVKAMRNINPYLKEGLTYDKAVNMVYEDFRGNVNFYKKEKLSLKDIENITNPVVRRGISQTIKVLNAIVRKYGSPEIVHIELARELSKGNKESVKKNQKIALEIKNLIKKEDVTENDIIRYRLWKDQNNTCIYTGENISLDELFTDEVGIDYIIPYSKSFDNTYSNKVLVKSSEIKVKGETLPIEYIKSNIGNVEEYRKRVKILCKSRKKRENLLTEEFTENDEIEAKENNLKDTQYITRLVLSLIKNNLYIKSNDNITEGKKIMAIRGGITYNVRKFLNIEKIRRSDRHHAIDAVIIAIINEKMVQNISEGMSKGLLMEKLNKYMPYEKFKQELEARAKETDFEVKEALASIGLDNNKKAIFVSKMPDRKVRGKAHLETITGISKHGNIIVRRKLDELKLDKNNEIDGYYNKKDDRLLYEALRKKLIEAKGNAKVAFSEPFFKPKADGSKGPIVNKVKLELKSSSNIKLERVGGVAGNGDTVRIDIFYVKDEGYYFVPIYVSDTIKEKLPNKACVSGKLQVDWKDMKDSDFIFSLYPGDLIYIKSNKGINFTSMKKGYDKEKIVVNEIYTYYIKCGINTASIAVSTHDRLYWQPSLGIKNLDSIKKFQVDVLGNYTENKLPEKRILFNKNK